MTQSTATRPRQAARKTAAPKRACGICGARDLREAAPMTTTTHRGTVDAGEFAALCNLFHTVHCEEFAPTEEQAGDILYHGANRMVCDESRLIARAVLAYLGISTGQPDADELISEVRVAMLNGQGSLPQD